MIVGVAFGENPSLLGIASRFVQTDPVPRSRLVAHRTGELQEQQRTAGQSLDQLGVHAAEELLPRCLEASVLMGRDASGWVYLGGTAAKKDGKHLTLADSFACAATARGSAYAAYSALDRQPCSDCSAVTEHKAYGA